MNEMQINNTLKTLVKLIVKNKQNIIDSNQQDTSACSNIDESMLDRLRIDENKISGMIESINQTAKLANPKGRTLYTYQHENGLKIENKTVPFGKILIIYESRPDVTIEATATAFKAGNKVLLKGGKESRNTNIFLVKLWQEALFLNGLDKNHIIYLDINRKKMQDVIRDNSYQIDLIIPRGGEGLINFVTQNTNIPVIISGRGNNFLYVDKESDFDMAIKIILNGKQRVSVCNALDKVLINQDVPDIKSKILSLVNSLKTNNIEILGSKNICELNNQIQEIEDESMFGEEFLSFKILLILVNNIDEAMGMTNKYSGGHSASIITTNNKTAEKFQNEVDCAAVYHNASTRFTDGGQFGFGAEIAISTQKLHFRGPIGINQLVTNKWFIYGKGQIRN
ncbi:MAG: glutamate-5-semialdehyde dehydrogenase [Parcubacteria group bacterium]|jgi:glutamate-5-semialdehyde dehydrogenase